MNEKPFMQELARYLGYCCLLLTMIFWIMPIFPWWLTMIVGFLLLHYAKAVPSKKRSSYHR